MKFLEFFKRKARVQPEDLFTVTITNDSVKVEYPGWQTEEVQWVDIQLIKLVNTDAGPVMPDIWLVLASETEKCVIPHGSKGFDEVYDRVSKYEGFDFTNFGQSMTCSNNAEFILWERNIPSQKDKAAIL
jgi:hypothetical protein